MLLFIFIVNIKYITNIHFNTSHVTVYLKGKPVTALWIGFQYISCYCLSESSRPDTGRTEISIHLMLLFIYSAGDKVYKFGSFQYISCYCLSLTRLFFTNSANISIHLMLLFIAGEVNSIADLMDFNTSHVTVYPISKLSAETGLRFQYISCYCLSP